MNTTAISLMVTKNDQLEDLKRQNPNFSPELLQIAFNIGCHNCAEPLKEDLSSQEAQQYLGVCNKTLYNYVNSGLLPKWKIGGRVRYKRADLDKLKRRCYEGQ